MSEMSDSESEKLTGKLEQVNETALKRLQTIAARKKADAVIGVELNYTQFASYSVGTIASVQLFAQEEARGESSYRKISVCQQLL